MKHRTKLPRCALAALAAGLAAGNAVGQDELEEIVVTAQKREQSVTDVPISLQVMAGEFLKSEGLSDLQDIARYLPNVIVDQGDDAGITIRARGIDTRGTLNSSFEQSVAVFNDGIYFGRGVQAIAGTLDLSRVEALMGPQPVYFGQSAIAGLLSYTSVRPTEELDGYGIVELGTQGQQKLEGAIGGGLADGWAGRIAGRYQQNDGWVRNFDGSDGNASSDWAFRGSLTGEVGDNLSVFAKTEQWEQASDGGRRVGVACDPALNPQNNQCAYAATRDPALAGVPIFQPKTLVVARGARPVPAALRGARAIDLTRVDAMQTDALGNDADGSNYLLQLDYELANNLLITSLTGYSEYTNAATIDVDDLPYAVFGLVTGEVYDALSQEARIRSAGQSGLQWMVGGYWQDQTIDSSNHIYQALPRGPTPGGITQSLTHEEATYRNGFGSITWDFAPVWTLDAGARWTHVTKDAILSSQPVALLDASGTDITGTARAVAAETGSVGGATGPPSYCLGATTYATAHGSWPCVVDRDPGRGRDPVSVPLVRDETEITWQLGLTWDFTDTHNVWVRHAKGFKPGGFSTARSSSADTETFGIYDGEYARTYEGGVHMSFLDNRLLLNSAYYFTDYENQQVQVQVLNPATGLNVLSFRNAGNSTVQGLEANLTWAPGNGFRLYAALATLEARYDSFAGAPGSQAEVRDALAVASRMGLMGPRAIGVTGPAGCTLSSVRGTSYGCTVDNSGREFSGQPDWTQTLRASYERQLAGRLKADVSVSATVYDDFDDTGHIPEPHRTQDGFAVLNLNAGIGAPDDRWRLSVYGRNITDEWYWLGQPSALNADGRGTANPNRTAHWGAQLRYNLGAR